MCRLSLLNKEGIEYLEKERGGIEKFFNHLEKSFGGHGNGYCIVTNDGKKRTIKGVKLSNKKIAEDILNNIKDVKWVLYHTRRASVGHISDRNCHPFERGESILMMNGTQSELKQFISGTMTDTEYILDTCYRNNENILKMVKEMKSVFVGVENNKVFITKGKGSLKLLKKGNAIIFASEFPINYYSKGNIYEAPTNWVEGKRITLKKLYKIEDTDLNLNYNYALLGSYPYYEKTVVK